MATRQSRDFIYPKTDGSGDLTTTDTGVAIFLKLVDAVPIARGTVINGTATAGDTLNINGEDVVFTTSSLGVVSVQNAVQDINAKTSDHKVTASASPAPNEVESDIATYGSAYGLIGGFTPASINGSVVNFSTTTAGQALMVCQLLLQMIWRQILMRQVLIILKQVLTQVT